MPSVQRHHLYEASFQKKIVFFNSLPVQWTFHKYFLLEYPMKPICSETGFPEDGFLKSRRHGSMKTTFWEAIYFSYASCGHCTSKIEVIRSPWRPASSEATACFSRNALSMKPRPASHKKTESSLESKTAFWAAAVTKDYSSWGSFQKSLSLS